MATSEILAAVSHRYFPLPERNWKYFQQWENTFFMHWSVKPEIIAELLPPGLVLDTFEGNAWISVVAFDVHKMRVHYLPPIPYISNFKEINVRTYVQHNGIKGIFMLSIETNKLIEVLLTRTFLELPYKKSYIKKSSSTLFSSNSRDNYKLVFDFKKTGIPTIKMPLDYWLTERHCLYNAVEDKLFRHDIHHKEWNLEEIDISISEISYNFSGIFLNRYPDKTHYCQSIDVLLWSRKRIL